jgi:allophanate hydrolase subunit 2
LALGLDDIPRRSSVLHVVLGPHDDRFAADAISLFLASTYEVSAASDRMGIRLTGPRIPHLGGFDVISDAVVTGTIQVPGGGEPIVMLADRQTTGGYPKLATVINADLPNAAQARPGSSLRFTQVSLVEAQRRRAALLARLAGLRARLLSVRRLTALSSDRLLSENLVSGVADAMAENTT